MVRRGSFGGGLNPLGGGSIGSFSGYDIGPSDAEAKTARDSAAALRAYKVSVDWANGQASDDEYLGSLYAQLSSTSDPEARISIENKIRDAEYTIGRSRAEAGGLDTLVAWEQAELAKMSPGNYRYAELRASLDSHMADRRSRDYQKLVDLYNDDKISTQQLIGFVSKMVATTPAGAPDADNWKSTLRSLTERLASERDDEMAHRKQMKEITDDQYLAYLTARRDQYSPISPKWDQMNQKVEEYASSLAAEKQRAADTKNQQDWQDGKKSDASYLLYIKNRLDALPKGDPDRQALEDDYAAAVFTVTQDKLQYDVEHGKRPASDMVAFLRTYQATLNPGSKTWRDTQDAIESWKDYHASGGGGGGGDPVWSRNPVPNARLAIGPAFAKLAADVIATTDPSVKAKYRTMADDVIGLNIDSLEAAVKRGETWWLFTDATDPNAVTNEIDPYTGKPTGRKVYGTRYYQANEADLAKLHVIKSNFFMAQSEAALKSGKGTTYLAKRGQALRELAEANRIDAKVGLTAALRGAKASLKARDVAETAGDTATAFFEGARLDAMVDLAMSNPNTPYADEEARAALIGIAEDLGSRKSIRAYNQEATLIKWWDANGVAHTTLFSETHDAEGNYYDPAFREAMALGNAEVLQTELNPGWYHTVNLADGPSNGLPGWGLEYDPVLASHQNPDLGPGDLRPVGGPQMVPITTTFGDMVVHSNAKITKAAEEVQGNANVDGPQVVPLLRLTSTNDRGDRIADYTIPVSDLKGQESVRQISFLGSNGKQITAFTIDGNTWVRTEDGSVPKLTYKGKLREIRWPWGMSNAFVGFVTTVGLADENGNQVFAQGVDGKLTFTSTTATPASLLGWMGENDARPVRVWSSSLGRYVNVINHGGYQSGGVAVDPTGVFTNARLGSTWNSVTTMTRDPESGAIDVTPTEEEYYRLHGLPSNLDQWMEDTYDTRVNWQGRTVFKQREQGPVAAFDPTGQRGRDRAPAPKLTAGEKRNRDAIMADEFRRDIPTTPDLNLLHDWAKLQYAQGKGKSGTKVDAVTGVYPRAIGRTAAVHPIVYTDPTPKPRLYNTRLKSTVSNPEAPGPTRPAVRLAKPTIAKAPKANPTPGTAVPRPKPVKPKPVKPKANVGTGLRNQTKAL